MLLKLTKDLPKNEHYIYSWICSMIIILADKNQTFRANIHYSIFENKIGGCYRRYINQLIDWNIIGVQLNEAGNETYSFNNKSGNNFNKCYYLTPAAIESGFTVVNYTTKRGRYYTMDENIINNEINVSNPIIDYTVKVIDNLEDNYEFEDVNKINEALKLSYKKEIKTNNMNKKGNGYHMTGVTKHIITHNLNETNYFNIFTKDEQRKLIIGEWWLKKLLLNNFTVKISPHCGRMYHPAICSPKFIKEFLWFKGCNTKVYYDIKSCFPVLLSKFIHADEKDKYKKYLDSDIYLTIKPDDRNGCKVEFQKFVNGFVKNYVHKFFKAELPLSYEYFKTNFKTLAMSLQQTESNIIIQKLVPFCIENNINNILTLHDGWMADGRIEEHEKMMVEYASNLFFQECGYQPTIKKETRTRHIEVINDNEQDDCCLDIL